jgi:hypothetical protein
MQSRLNTIQMSMWQWNAMHPYSAVNAARLRACINATVARHGLTRLSLDCARLALQEHLEETQRAA